MLERLNLFNRALPRPFRSRDDLQRRLVRASEKDTAKIRGGIF